ncbi:MAG: hypothetical protein MUF54_21485 [Polyangiaceae bacterium]|jgi:hypothetical protein|nr:hypothetical protein [Polyangiaceae bacterium]
MIAALVASGLGSAAGCGGTAREPAAAASAAVSSAAPLQPQPSQGASTIELATRVGGCAVTVRTSLGASYRFAPSHAKVVTDGMASPLQACWAGASGTHGTAHVSGKVGSDGKLGAVVVSPGGALSTHVATCLGQRLEGASLAPSEAGADALLVFVVSDCAVD